jgi:DNA-binding XRE family transcriptional regulator
VQLTTKHTSSNYGIPVFVDEDGSLIDYAEGLRRLRKERGWTVSDLASQVGVSPRTVEGWEQGRMPSKSALILLCKI